jgi:hypothetical protein
MIIGEPVIQVSDGMVAFGFFLCMAIVLNGLLR